MEPLKDWSAPALRAPPLPSSCLPVFLSLLHPLYIPASLHFSFIPLSSWMLNVARMMDGSATQSHFHTTERTQKMIPF